MGKLVKQNFKFIGHDHNTYFEIMDNLVDRELHKRFARCAMKSDFSSQDIHGFEYVITGEYILKFREKLETTSSIISEFDEWLNNAMFRQGFEGCKLVYEPVYETPDHIQWWKCRVDTICGWTRKDIYTLFKSPVLLNREAVLETVETYILDKYDLVIPEEYDWNIQSNENNTDLTGEYEVNITYDITEPYD